MRKVTTRRTKKEKNKNRYGYTPSFKIPASVIRYTTLTPACAQQLPRLCVVVTLIAGTVILFYFIFFSNFYELTCFKVPWGKKREEKKT